MFDIASRFPLVSVVVTTRNEGKNISRLLASVKKESYKKLEIIVVDYKSSDKTIEISKSFTPKVYSNGPERSTQRNYGAWRSKGKYLLFLDADMELTGGVIQSCIKTALKGNFRAVTIPERTVGKNFMAKLREFERGMYMGDPSVELARFFERDVFFEFGGYDPKLTGPEDFDLYYRVSKKYQVGRAKEFILHHEEELTLKKLLKKRFYYANKGAYYAQKHPELIFQGILILRKAYLKNWKKFLRNPDMGLFFVLMRILESIWALAGFIRAIVFKR